MATATSLGPGQSVGVSIFTPLHGRACDKVEVADPHYWRNLARCYVGYGACNMPICQYLSKLSHTSLDTYLISQDGETVEPAE